MVSRAREVFSQVIGIDLSPQGCGADSYAHSALLCFPHTKANKAATQAICTFNAAVWLERTYTYDYYKPRTRHKASSVIHRICQSAIYAWERFKCPKLEKGFGNASTRSAAQRKLAREYAERIIAQMDPAGTIAYTDGSALGNPGPSGAGVFLHTPDTEQELAIGLRQDGTNNLGELWAIGAAIQAVEALASNDPSLNDRPAYIITDSLYSLGCLTKNWKATGQLNAAVIAAIRKRLSASTIQWHINWVPGHAGVEGNEVADGAAGRGAERSRRGKGITDLLQRARAFQFIPN